LIANTKLPQSIDRAMDEFVNRNVRSRSGFYKYQWISGSFHFKINCCCWLGWL